MPPRPSNAPLMEFGTRWLVANSNHSTVPSCCCVRDSFHFPHLINLSGSTAVQDSGKSQRSAQQGHSAQQQKHVTTSFRYCSMNLPSLCIESKSMLGCFCWITMYLVCRYRLYLQIECVRCMNKSSLCPDTLHLLSARAQATRIVQTAAGGRGRTPSLPGRLFLAATLIWLGPIKLLLVLVLKTPRACFAPVP